jgi:site-specific recombinase XerD
MMATDFAVSLRRFLTDHMAGLRGCSPNTISSYRDAFKLLICYFRDERSIPPERLTLELLDVTAVTEFIAWLRTSRHNSPSTCNQRLAAISSYFQLDANPRSGADGVLPGHPRDPLKQARPARHSAPDREADPAAARLARPLHPPRAP